MSILLLYSFTSLQLLDSLYPVTFIPSITGLAVSLPPRVSTFGATGRVKFIIAHLFLVRLNWRGDRKCAALHAPPPTWDLRPDRIPIHANLPRRNLYYTRRTWRSCWNCCLSAKTRSYTLHLSSL
jgi:hypothetical protein